MEHEEDCGFYWQGYGWECTCRERIVEDEEE